MSEDDLNLEYSDKKSEARIRLTASGIAEYIRFNCCPRFFKLKFEDDEEAESRKWPEAFKPISPLLYGVGKALEEKKVSELKEKAAEYHDFNKYELMENEQASLNNLRRSN